MVRILPTKFKDVLLLEPNRHRDARGQFMEVWRADAYAAVGLDATFVQDNVSYSLKGVLRGLHFQYPRTQGKLVTCLHGEVFDVVVDIRRNSPSFSEWFGCRLSMSNGRQLYIPPGFAHGFVVTSESATFLYKCTENYDPQGQFSIRWNDASIGIDWPVSAPILAEKDRAALGLSELEAILNW